VSALLRCPLSDCVCVYVCVCMCVCVCVCVFVGEFVHMSVHVCTYMHDQCIRKIIHKSVCVLLTQGPLQCIYMYLHTIYI